MTGKKDRWVQFIPQKPADMASIVPWGIDRCLDLIEEVACGPQVYGTDVPDKEEAAERIFRSLGTDWKADEVAIEDRVRAELREWWRDVPERQLFVHLYQQADLRKAGHRSSDSSRKPSRDQCLTVAKPLLAHIPDTGPWDPEWESAAVSVVLAAPPPMGVFSPGILPEYIRRSEESRVYFDAVERIEEEAKSRHQDIPRPHAVRRRRRPARNRLPRGRQHNPAILRRNIQIQFTIEVLNRVGIRPQGTYVSGCRIVSEALDRPVDTVERIWKARLWERSFVPVMQEHSKAMPERTGPFHTTEV